MHLIVSVQHERGGSVLMLAAEHQRPDAWVPRAVSIVTPAMVAAAIREAVAEGWRPTESGPPFCFKLKA